MVKKVTFTLDEATIARLQTSSERLGKPKSEVVREAIAEHHERLGRLSESEKTRLLRIVDELLPRIPQRPAKDVDREFAAVRGARRSGGRR